MTDSGVLIVGVGGQGTLLASRIFGDVAARSGFDVKVSEVHGMAQRGGSVVTHVKFGKAVYSPLVGQGQADFILAFEKLEALRWAGHLKKQGTIIVNDKKIVPVPVNLGYQRYPENIERNLTDAAKAYFVDASRIAVECGNIKAVNIVLLGVLAGLLPFDRKLWEDVISETVPPKTIETNLRAFNEGLKVLEIE